MATLTPTRPRMPYRAISDMNPLMSPLASNDKGDLGRGTQATSGGAKVTSCGRTALGGIAPLSPFLPLPPAPTSEELQRRCSQDKAFLDVTTAKAPGHVRFATSTNQSDTPSKKSRGAALTNAPHMIRSYSLPVATQRDYEFQREMFRKKQQLPSAINGGSLAILPEKIANANTMTTSKSTMGTSKTKHQLDCDARQQNFKKASPRPALSTITINEVHSRYESNEMDLESSGSDEADVITPRACSPATDYFAKSSSAPPFDNLAFFIHPSHLQPPVGFTTSS